MSGFNGIHISSTALRAFQVAMDVAGNNIANVNTPGYSRQRVNLSAVNPITFWSHGGQSLGQGVTIDSITRARDLFLSQRSQQLNGDASRSQTLAAGLSTIEGMYNEPGEAGISNALGQFFDAWSALGSRPDDPALRTQVQMAGLTLTERVRTAAEQLNTLEGQTQIQVEASIKQVNTLASKIADLNRQIVAASAGGGNANDLADQRDAAISELSGLIDVSVQEFQDGSYAVYAGNFSLVDGAGARTLPNTYNAATGQLLVNGNPLNLSRGSLTGNLQMMVQINQRQAELDSVANNMVTQINALHNAGTTGNGATNIDFFHDPGVAQGAIGFRLSDDVIASANNIAAGTTTKAGDGGLASSIAALRDTNQVALGNRSFVRFYEDALDNLSAQASYYSTSADTTMALQEQVKSQLDAVTGVSLDDEMADMMKLQRSYQAAAKALTVADQMAEDVINMLRR
jgi:flagellar hook-associated protein 1 FlgK